MLSDATVFITGGAGFIGSTLGTRMADHNSVTIPARPYAEPPALSIIPPPNLQGDKGPMNRNALAMSALTATLALLSAAGASAADKPEGAAGHSASAVSS